MCPSSFVDAWQGKREGTRVARTFLTPRLRLGNGRRRLRALSCWECAPLLVTGRCVSYRSSAAATFHPCV